MKHCSPGDGTQKFTLKRDVHCSARGWGVRRGGWEPPWIITEALRTFLRTTVHAAVHVCAVVATMAEIHLYFYLSSLLSAAVQSFTGTENL